MAAIPPSMPASTANWHWKNKNVTPWAKTWFQRELTTISIKSDDEQEVFISSVVEVDGDVELGQRKSKYVSYRRSTMSALLNAVSISQATHDLRLQSRPAVEG